MHPITRTLGRAAAALLLTASALAAAPSRADSPAPEDRVLVPGFVADDGAWVEVAWRERARPGFSWVDGDVTWEGGYLPGHWQPDTLRPGYVWVIGHRADDGVYTLGFWRAARQAGAVWVPGFYQDGRWVEGDWAPTEARAGFVWVPGHVDDDDVFEGGFWRDVARDGFVWVDGYYDEGGAWYGGHWAPTEPRPGYVWVPGYAVNGVWYDGFWRPDDRPGYTWVPGGWCDGRFVSGHWVLGELLLDLAFRAARYAELGGPGPFARGSGRRVRHVTEIRNTPAHARPVDEARPAPLPTTPGRPALDLGFARDDHPRGGHVDPFARLDGPAPRPGTKRAASPAAFSDPFFRPSTPSSAGVGERDTAADRGAALRHYELQRGKSGSSSASSSYGGERRGSHRALERAPSKSDDSKSASSKTKASSDDDDKKSSPDLGSSRRRR
ncbi:MAG: hypothetical protein KC635_16385 [Myxococcales bacterium]|nr:hypothetical protein [Myxococcales bacterium]MCB9732875.1 hypothetical protein [Deltaproteobacteria bacterium]